MTYDELLNTVQSYTIRDDAPISGFISRAEASLRPIAKHYLSEKAVRLPVVDNNEVALPADFLETRAITGSKTYRPVSVANADLCENEVGYYRQNNRLIFVGEPDAEIGILYHAAFAGLADSQSNWLFDRFPNVYLAAILKEFYRWEKDAEGVAIEQAALNEALAIVAEDDRRGRVTGTIVMEKSTAW